MQPDERLQRIKDAIQNHDGEFLLSDEFLRLCEELKVPQENVDMTTRWARMRFPSMQKILKAYYTPIFERRMRRAATYEDATRSGKACEVCDSLRKAFAAASKGERYGEALEISNQLFEHRKKAGH